MAGRARQPLDRVRATGLDVIDGVVLRDDNLALAGTCGDAPEHTVGRVGDQRLHRATHDPAHEHGVVDPSQIPRYLDPTVDLNVVFVAEVPGCGR